MTHIYDQTTRAAVRKRMSPPNRESVAQIARDTGITEQTLYNWRRSWQQQGDLVPATGKSAEQWSAAAKFAVVLQTAGLNGTELGAFCRERGLYPQQVARWRQAGSGLPPGGGVGGSTRGWCCPGSGEGQGARSGGSDSRRGQGGEKRLYAVV